MSTAPRSLSLVALALFSAPLLAQTCPPQTLCGPGGVCAPVVCGPGLASGSTTITVVDGPPTSPGGPPVSVSIPRFVPGPGQTLVQAELELELLLSNGSIHYQNLGSGPITVQLELSTTVSIQSAFPPLAGTGASLTAAASFLATLSAQTCPVCAFTCAGPDMFSVTNVNAREGRRICISDPSLLAQQFTATPAQTGIDFLVSTTDASSHTGPGGVCMMFTNVAQVRLTATYTWCGPPVLPGTPGCAGDGTQATPCPCANSGAPGRGCANSAGPGARLGGTGTTLPDEVVLQSSGEPASALSIVLQGNAVLPAPIAFGDGLRCLDGQLLRLYMKNASAGVVTAPGAGDVHLRARAAQLGDPIPSGGTRRYAVFYRDPDAAFCPAPAGATFNISNDYAIVWP